MKYQKVNFYLGYLQCLINFMGHQITHVHTDKRFVFHSSFHIIVLWLFWLLRVSACHMLLLNVLLEITLAYIDTPQNTIGLSHTFMIIFVCNLTFDRFIYLIYSPFQVRSSLSLLLVYCFVFIVLSQTCFETPITQWPRTYFNFTNYL